METASADAAAAAAASASSPSAELPSCEFAAAESSASTADCTPSPLSLIASSGLGAPLRWRCGLPRRMKRSLSGSPCACCALLGAGAPCAAPGAKSEAATKDHHAKDHHAKSHHTKDNHAKGNHMWAFVAVVSAMAYGGLSFFQYVITKKNSKLNMISLAICVTLVEAVIGALIYCLAHFKELEGIEAGPFKNYRKDVNSLMALKYLPYTTSTAACDGMGLAALLKSYTLAKNPGFSDVVSDTYSMVQGVLTYLVYGKKMDVVQGLAVVIAVAGAALISIK